MIRGRRSAHRPRRAFCVGLAKSGTHSIAHMLLGACRVTHEAEPDALLPLLPAARRGAIPVGELRSFLRDRDRRLAVDFEASHLLGSFVPHLLDAFPDARFLLLVRDCQGWIDSMINDQINLRSWSGYPRWQVVYDTYLGSTERRFPPEEEELRRLDLYPLANYVRSWRDQVTAVVRDIPPEQLLVLRTDALSISAATVGRFLDLPVEAIAVDQAHSYQAPRRHHVLDRLPPDYARQLIETEVRADSYAITCQFAWPGGAR
jgi:hypothetical protein